MGFLRLRPLRLLLVAAVLATLAAPWFLDPQGIAVAWYEFEFVRTPVEGDAMPHPGETAPVALFRALGGIGLAVALGCVLGVTRKAWRPGVDLVATLAILGVAAGFVLSVLRDGRPPLPLAAIGGASLLLAAWSLVAPLLGDASVAEEAIEEADEEEGEEEEEEDEDIEEEDA